MSTDPDRKTIHTIATQHLDIAWLWNRSPDGEELMRQCFQRAVELIEADPEKTHIHSRSTAWGYWIVEQRWPELFEKIKAYVASGHIELCGGQWVEPDNILPDGEAMIRESLTGQIYFKTRFGKTATVAWNPDVFCHGNTLPQIYTATGLEGYYFHRSRPLDDNGSPRGQFVWEGPDGSRVYCFTGRWQGTPDAENIREVDNALADSALPADYVVTGLRSDRRITMNRRWLENFRSAAEGTKALLRWSAADDMLEHMKTYAGQLPVLKGDLGGYMFTGTYTSDGITKRFNRKLENDLCDAEILSVIASFRGGAYDRDTLTDCWRDLCVNHFHDIGCGTCYRSAQEEAHALYRSIEKRTDHLMDLARNTLAATTEADAGSGSPVVVFNTLSFPRQEAVVLDVEHPSRTRVRNAEGEIVPSQPVHTGERKSAVIFLPTEPVPGLGHAVYYIETVTEAASTDPTPDFVLENRHIRCGIDSITGEFNTLCDKQTGREYIPADMPANHFEYWQDKNGYAHSPDHMWDPWFIRLTEKYGPVGAFNVRVVENGPVRKVVRVAKRLSLHPDLPDTVIEQFVILECNSPFVTIRVRGEWHARQCMLKAAFHLKMKASRVVCDMPYGVIERSPEIVSKVKVDAGSAAEDRVEHGSEREEPDRPMQKWVDFVDDEGGIAFLNNGRYGYDSTPDSVRLSLMRAPMIRENEVAGLGPFDFAYAVLPHRGDWRDADLARRGLAFNRPLHAIPSARHKGGPRDGTGMALFAVDNDNVLITAIKRAELDDRIVVRLYESAGRGTECRFTSGIPVEAAAEANAIEEELPGSATHAPCMETGLPLRFRPFEIKTLLLTIPPAHLGSARHPRHHRTGRFIGKGRTTCTAEKGCYKRIGTYKLYTMKPCQVVFDKKNVDF